MALTRFQWYLIGINIIAFSVYTIDFQKYNHGGGGIKPKVLCNLVTISGGALGALVAEFLWDRKINKNNAQSRLYTVVWLIIYLVFVLALYGPNHMLVQQKASEFYQGHKALCWYIFLINIVSFIAFGLDKIKAVLHKWRIREIILLRLSLMGGSAGALLAMDIFNHKVKSSHFIIGIPLILCVHLLILVFIQLGII